MNNRTEISNSNAMDTSESKNTRESYYTSPVMNNSNAMDTSESKNTR